MEYRFKCLGKKQSSYPGRLSSTSALSQYVMHTNLFCRFHEAKRDGTAVVYVDGSYQFRKHQKLSREGTSTSVVPELPPPPPPLTGWEHVTVDNHEVAERIPRVMPGLYE